MHFYTNENFPFQVVLKLRELGHNVKTSHEAGYANQAISDLEVLQTSIQEQRILLTLNRRDFIKIHQQNSNHHGIIVCKVGNTFEELALKIHQLTLEQDAQFFNNQLLRVHKN